MITLEECQREKDGTNIECAPNEEPISDYITKQEVQFLIQQRTADVYDFNNPIQNQTVLHSIYPSRDFVFMSSIKLRRTLFQRDDDRFGVGNIMGGSSYDWFFSASEQSTNIRPQYKSESRKYLEVELKLDENYEHYHRKVFSAQ